MKTVLMVRDFDYTPHRKWSVRFKQGICYSRVLDAAARAIEQAEAGRIVPQTSALPPNCVDASKVWRPRYGRR
jgi:hypothetical protein